MNRRLFLAAPAVLIPAAAALAADDSDVAIVMRQTQELNDAVTYGRAEVWSRYLHDNAVYSDEEGAVTAKAELVSQIQPLPAGVSGVLTTQDFQAHRTGDIIIANYVVDEHETYHTAEVHCQYRNTSTWVRTSDGWRLLAIQAMALRTDPPEVVLRPRQLAEYPGVYRLSGDTTYTVRLRDGVLYGQQTGGRERPLKAEVADLFFSPGRPRYRYVFGRDARGNVNRLIQRREAWDMVFTREGEGTDNSAFPAMPRRS